MAQDVAVAILRDGTTHVQANQPVGKRGFAFRILIRGKSPDQNETPTVVAFAHPCVDRSTEHRQRILISVFL
jgi:hypothetical protein